MGSRRWPLLVFIVLGVVPLGWSVAYALAYSLGLVGLFARGFTLEHWAAVLGGSETWSTLAYTTAVSGCVVVVGVGLALMCALAIGPRLDQGLAAVAAHLPLAFPAAVTALVTFGMFSGTGLTNDRWAIGIVAAQLFTTVPFLTLAFRAHYVATGIAALESVAVGLGATRGQLLQRITVPLLVRGCASTIALTFVATFGAYEIPQILGRQTPQMISVLVLRKLARYDLTEKPQALAIAVMYAAAMAVVVSIALRRRRPAR